LALPTVGGTRGTNALGEAEPPAGASPVEEVDDAPPEIGGVPFWPLVTLPADAAGGSAAFPAFDGAIPTAPLAPGVCAESAGVPAGAETVLGAPPSTAVTADADPTGVPAPGVPGPACPVGRQHGGLVEVPAPEPRGWKTVEPTAGLGGCVFEGATAPELVVSEESPNLPAL
jgi:hypothetical protein